jgi:hypothetical protein
MSISIYLSIYVCMMLFVAFHQQSTYHVIQKEEEKKKQIKVINQHQPIHQSYIVM